MWRFCFRVSYFFHCKWDLETKSSILWVPKWPEMCRWDNKPNSMVISRTAVKIENVRLGPYWGTLLSGEVGRPFRSIGLWYEGIRLSSDAYFNLANTTFSRRLVLKKGEPLSKYRFKGMQLVGNCCIPCRLSGWIKRFVNKTFEGLDNIHTNLHKFLQPFIRYCSGWMDRKLNLIIINKSKIKFYVNCSLIKPKWSIQHEPPPRSS